MINLKNLSYKRRYKETKENHRDVYEEKMKMEMSFLILNAFG